MKTKLLLFFLIIFLGLGLNSVAFAQENETDTAEETIKAEDLDIKEPALLPDSPFYFLKEWGRGVQSFFAFGQIKKSELEQKFANERLMELKKLVDNGKNAEIIKRATEKYEKTIEKLKTRSEKIKEKAEDSEKVESFLEKFTKQQLLHQAVLEKLESQVPEEVFEKIKEAREMHLERFEQVMNKLEDRKEKKEEKINNAREQIKEKIKERKKINKGGDENEIGACITLWDPVCGKDKKTYSNECSAEKAGAEINYKGECRECGQILCIWDPCPGKHLPDEKGCVNCSSPCKDKTEDNSGIKGKITRGPMCPVVRAGEDCPDKPYPEAVIVISLQNQEIVRVTSDENGEFSVRIGPGTYVLEQASQNIFPSCPSKTVTVNSGEIEEITISCDTGIR